MSWATKPTRASWFGRRPRTATEDGDRSSARPQESHGELKQRGLAGTVRPDEPDDLAGRNGERALRQRPLMAVALAEAIGLQDGGHATSSAAGGPKTLLVERIDALVIETCTSRLPYPALQTLTERSVSGERVVAERLRDEDANARPCRHETEMLQLLVCLQHRVRVDRKTRDHLLQGRELVANLEEPEAQRVADLLDDLLVGRDARALVEMKFNHG